MNSEMIIEEVFREADDYVGHPYDEDESPTITHCRTAFINGAVFGASNTANKFLKYLENVLSQKEIQKLKQEVFNSI